MRTFTSTIIAGLILVLDGCQNTPSVVRALPPPDPARLAQYPPGDIAEAAKIHALKCAKCHQFYNPADYSEAEWRSWMIKMARKARLRQDQQELLSRYLDAFRPPTRRGE